VSDDPSPWAEFSEPFPEPDRPSTEEMLRELALAKQEEAAEQHRNAVLFEKYGYRMTADGRLIA
jgi:hypothetical protein